MKKYHLHALIVLACLFLGSCHTYYMDWNTAKKKKPITSPTGLDSLNRSGRYFILRSGVRSWHMSSVVLAPDRKSFTCKLESIAPEHKHHLDDSQDKNMRYRPDKVLQKEVIKEVHLYVSEIPESWQESSGVVTVPLVNINKIEVLTRDKGRTTSSQVAGFFGVTAGIILVAGIIVAATKSSCPFVSAYDGSSFVLQGEVFGGAVYPQLARHDYLPLALRPSPDGSLRILIHNELKEKQHTDVAHLRVATHDKDVEVLTDPNGNLHTVANTQPPLSAQLGAFTDVRRSLEAEDDNILEMSDSSQETGNNDVMLRFANPGRVKSAKLILRLKNSLWLDLLYGEIARGLGTAYEKYVERQKKAPAVTLQKWVEEQNIPLQVSVRVGEDWKVVELVKPVGPVAFRKIALPLELDGSEQVEIKLTSGFMFWEFDYAALDTEKNRAVEMVTLSPESAVDQDGQNRLKEIAYEDNLYMDQPAVGDAVTLVYRHPSLSDPSRTRSYFLDAAGYYEPIRQFDTRPDVKFLKQFRKPDAMARYGMRLYNRNLKEVAMAYALTK